MKLVAKVMVAFALVGFCSAFTSCNGSGSANVTTTTTSH